MKDDLRKKLKAMRRSLSAAEIAASSEKINKRLKDVLSDKRCVMVYLSSFKEVCIDDTIRVLLGNGAIAAAPVTNEADFSITPFRLTDLNSVMHGAYGIREPLKNQRIDKRVVEAVIVPGIGFDRNGGRIGFGKGCYDRFLSDFDGLKIGVCYDFQLVDKIETDKNDIPMDVIITESGCYVI